MTIPRPVSKPPTRKLPAPLYAISKKIRTRGMTAEEISWDDYLIPGMAEDVLRNKVGLKSEPYGCTDADLLREREERFTAFRMVELQKKPIPGLFDSEHMGEIHRHLFQDVYEWAGEPRSVFMSKAGYDYAEPEDMGMLLVEQHRTLVEENKLRGIYDKDEFVEKLAFHWGMINYAHKFREGNTRTQVVMFHQLAKKAGYDLDVARLSPNHPESVRDEFIEARFHHQGNGFDTAPLVAVLSKVITRTDPDGELEQGLRLPKRERPESDKPDVGAQLLETIRDNLKNAPMPYSTKIEPEHELNLDDRFRKFPELASEPAPRHRLGAEQGGPEL